MSYYCRHIFLALIATLLVACGSHPRATSLPEPVTQPAVVSGTGYYGGDKPPTNIPVNLDRIQDAIPQPEPLSKTGNKPYKALGKRYVPMSSAEGFYQTGTASWYGKKFHGRRTSSGEPYDMFAMTAAHPTLPLPTYVKVTNLDNNRQVVVKVNDRGPFLHGRIIDLSYAAAHKLDIARSGTGRVYIEVVSTGHYRAPVGNSSSTQSIQQTNPVPTSAARYVLQVGAYSDWQNAANMRQLLDLAGYTLWPQDPDMLRQLPQPYRVQVGPFRSRHQAREKQQAVQTLLGREVGLFTVTLP